MEKLEIGKATLYHGDALEILPSLSLVDVVITDPPYGLGFEYGTFQDTRENVANLISTVMPMLREKASRVCVMPGITQVFLYPEPDWIMSVVWNTTGSFGKYGYTQWMPVLLYGTDLKGFGNVNGVMKTDTLQISGGGGVGFMRTGDKEHPCPKPQTVMKKIVQRLGTGTVLDPFAGVGSTGIACLDLGMKFIGIELERKFFDIACKRIEQAQRQMCLYR